MVRRDDSGRSNRRRPRIHWRDHASGLGTIVGIYPKELMEEDGERFSPSFPAVTTASNNKLM